MTALLSREGWLAAVGAELGRDLSPAELSADLVDDLDFDSLDLLVLVDGLHRAGAQLDEQGASALRTLAGAYEAYCVGVVAAEWDATPPTSPLTGRLVRLRPVLTTDTDWLLSLLTHDGLGPGGPLRGATPGPAEIHAVVHHDVAAQFVVEGVGSGRPVGLVACRRADPAHGYAYLDVVVDPYQQGRGWPLEGLLLLVDHVFAHLRLRKLYAEVPGFVWDRLAGALRGPVLHQGTLRDHTWHDGRWWDTHVLAVPRPAWLAWRKR